LKGVETIGYLLRYETPAHTVSVFCVAVPLAVQQAPDAPIMPYLKLRFTSYFACVLQPLASKHTPQSARFTCRMSTVNPRIERLRGPAPPARGYANPRFAKG
jgi:hypothetical protein